MLNSTGPLLGLQELWGWEFHEKQVYPLDRVVLVTDGLAEARGLAPDFFGRHCGRSPQADDWTLLAGELGNGR